MKCKNLTYDHIEITGGFWKDRQDLIRKTTIWNVYKRFKETGRFDAFKLNWKEGEPNRPHIFWDSDVAKWVEGVAYLTSKQREPELEAIVDEVVDDIERGRAQDGYFNSYYLQIEPQNRFTVRDRHELYCLGHLIEAAIAYDQATKKGKLLSLVKDYVALVKRIFMEENSAVFEAPGHEELELALVRLYDYTGERQYLDLALHFVNRRGQKGKPDQGWAQCNRAYEQDHMPVREQQEAIGHAVRAVYLYCAMADLAERLDDEELKTASERLYRNIVEKKMYITGAIGSTRRYEAIQAPDEPKISYMGEAFEEEYHLPNDTAYAETCAALGLALFSRRMQLLNPDASYADTVERVLYNGFMSGMSLDGKAFFYVNSQEIDLEARRRMIAFGRSQRHYPTERVEIFSCSCCPPNVVRFIPSVADFLYHYDENTIYVNQYMQSTADFGNAEIEQITNYPFDGRIALKLTGAAKQLALRIPAWCHSFTVKKNGTAVKATAEKGYLPIHANSGDVVELHLEMTPRRIYANPAIRANRGKVALAYGPFIYCMEGVDNGEHLGEVSVKEGEIICGFDENLGLPTLLCPAVRETMDGLYGESLTQIPFTAKLIPSFAFANRGETDMRIWHDKA